MLPGSCLYLLDLDEEALKFRRVCVGIEHSRSESVGERSGVFALVFGNTPEALMDGQAHLKHSLPVNHHGLDAFRDHRLGDVVTPRAG